MTRSLFSYLAACALTLSLVAGRAEPACIGSDCPTTAGQKALTIFDEIARAGSPGLRVWTNDGSATYEIGEHLTFSFASDQELYLTVLHIDSHGAVTILLSGDAPSSALFSPGKPVTLPPNGAPYQIHPNEPVGIETIYALGTPLPLRTEWLLSGTSEPFPVLDSVDTLALAHRLKELLTGRQELEGYAAARFDQQIAKASNLQTGPQYTSTGIVEYFTTRHRAIRRPRLDLDIKFDSGEASLTESARTDLSEVGKALDNPLLRGERFRLTGHTDDVGQAEDNQRLSELRAQETMRYLLTNFDISDRRLETRGAGESSPLVATLNDSARSMNRRVELELLRPELRGDDRKGLASVATVGVADLDLSGTGD